MDYVDTKLDDFMSMHFLRETARVVFDKALDLQGPVALLDFPNHNNVGDSAIWLGERQYLMERGVSLSFVASVSAYSLRVLKKVMPTGTILLHGGGNFGTLWPLHQELREDVLRNCKNYRVIQLPQSLHFDDHIAHDRCAELIKEHPDFTLMARDKNSMELGFGLGAKCIFSPDAAHFLYGRLHRERPLIDAFGLMRKDKERAFSSAIEFDSDLTFQMKDWSEGHAGWLFPVVREFERRSHGRFGRFGLFQAAALHLYDRIAWERLRAGIRLISRGKVMVTDRLHGHILASLLGIPNVVLDNTYGKVHGYMNSWDGGVGFMAKSSDEARELVRNCLNKFQ